MALTSAPLLPGVFQFFDNNGVPLAPTGPTQIATLYTFVPGGSTSKTTWQDPTQTIANANPIELDAAGRCVMFGAGQYRLQLFDQLGNLLWDNLGAAADLNSIQASLAPFTGDTGAGGAQGVVPAPPAGSAANGFYLTAGGIWAPLLVKVPAAPSANQAGFLFVPGRTIAAATGTLALTDAGSEVNYANASVASTLTIPTDAAALWRTDVATQIMISNEIGSGALTIAPSATVNLVWPGSSATPANRTLAANGQCVLTHKRASNLWTIIGAGVS